MSAISLQNWGTGRAIQVSLFLFSLFCSVGSPAQTRKPTLPLAEQQVIEALFQHEVGSAKKHVIREEMSAREIQFQESYEKFGASLRQDAKEKDKAFKAALDDFLQKNRNPTLIAFPTNAPKDVELVSEATVNSIFRNTNNVDGWKLFYERFPGSTGLISISRVGMNPQKTVAIVYFGQQSHWLAGAGSIRVLRREGNKWVVTGEGFGRSWVS